jgi:hypothetical protein
MSRGEEELSAQPQQRGTLETRRRAQSLEPRQQVVCQQHELEESLGAAEVLHGDLVERIRGLELADNEFGPRAIVVGTPHCQRGPAQIGDEDLIRIPLHLEKVQLGGRLLGDRAPDDDKSRGALPPLGAIAEFGGPEIAPDTLIVQAAQSMFDRRRQSSTNDVPSTSLFQPCAEKPIVEGCVGPHPKRLALGQPAQCLLDNRANDFQDVCLPRMQGTLQAVAGMSFETEDRVVGGPALLPGIVADLRKLLMAIDRLDSPIQIRMGCERRGASIARR